MEPDFHEIAITVANYMRREGAVRRDEKEISNFLTREEIAAACGFYLGHWTRIKEAMLENGNHIAFRPGKGHYLGWPGEESYNVLFAHRMANGWGQRTSRYLRSMSANGTSRADWAKEHYDLDWEEIERQYGQEE